jgi:hypothetical protein
MCVSQNTATFRIIQTNRRTTYLLSRPTDALHIYLYVLLLTAIELSLGGSSSYNSTDKTNKNKYTYTKQYKNAVQTIQNTVNASTHYQNTHTIVSTPPCTLTHTLQNQLKQPQYKIHTK